MVSTEAPPAYSPPSLDLTLVAAPGGREVLVTVRAPPVTSLDTTSIDKRNIDAHEDVKSLRAPVDFVLTIDVSGSMRAPAPAPGESENTGLSVLDVVKHAAKTIIVTMKPADRVAIVTFSSQAKEEYPLSFTTQEGKAAALECIEGLRTETSTNLWGGLKKSMNILTGAEVPSAFLRIASASSSIAASIVNTLTGRRSSPPTSHQPERLSSIFLLTDGSPTVTPPRGHLPMLKQYLESHPPEKTNFTINTFGFSYSLDSLLLHEVAKIGNGHFGFIPDAGMVGTTFVHAIANTYATYAGGLYIDIELEDEAAAKDMEVLGSFESTKTSWGVQVPMGVLQYDQSRDLIVKLPSSVAKGPLVVNARCRPWDSKIEVKTTRVLNEQLLPAAESAIPIDLLYHTHRLTFVTEIYGLYDMQKIEVSQWMANSNSKSMVTPDTEGKFTTLAQNIRASCPNHDDAVALAEDIEGQVLLAIKDASAMDKWGRYYLLSLSRSHQRQQCGNFKDPGLMVYGKDSQLFKAWRDEIDKTFDDLPPPTPSQTSMPVAPLAAIRPLSATPSYWNTSSSRKSFTPMQSSARFFSSMQSYNQQHAPCFAGSAPISLADGSMTVMSKLSVGATVETPTGSARVVDIIQTKVDPLKNLMCKFDGGLVITPWHPVNINGWKFPIDLVAPAFVHSNDIVYSILLEENADSDAHSVFIGGVQCVTLGHGVEAPGDTRTHPFLSNHSLIMADLVGAPEDPTTGAKLCKGLRRDVFSGLITGFDWIGEASSAGNVSASAMQASLVSA